MGHDRITTTTRLTVLDPNCTDHWMEVHKMGCADLRRPDRHGGRKGEGAWQLSAASLTEAAESIAGDFLNEGSMTIGDALEHIHFAPCVRLPESLIDGAGPCNREGE